MEIQALGSSCNPRLDNCNGWLDEHGGDFDYLITLDDNALERQINKTRGKTDLILNGANVWKHFRKPGEAYAKDKSIVRVCA